MTAHVSAYFEDTGTLIEDDLEVTLTDDDAQPAVTWTGRRGPLALDGRAHLDLTAAAAATYDQFKTCEPPHAQVASNAGVGAGHGLFLLLASAGCPGSGR